MPLPSFWSRLRKGRFVQVLLVYLGASWLLLQVAEALTEALSLPPWVLPLVVLLLLVGLLIVLATAWVQAQPLVRERAAADEVPEAWELDVRDLGRAVRSGRLPHLTWARALGGGFIAFSLLFGIAGVWVLLNGPPGGGAVRAADGGAAPGVAVLPFETRGVQDELWGEGLVDLLSANLDGVAGLRTIDSRTVLARWRERGAAEGADLQTALDVARSTGARYALLGSVVGAGNRVRVSAQLHDVATGSEVGAARVEGRPDSVIPLLDALSVGLVRELLAREELGEAPPRNLASVTTSSVPALRAYLRGEAATRRADFPAAALAYADALAADSTFALAAYRLALAYGWMDNRGAEEVEELMDRAVRFSDRMPRRDAALLRAYHGATRQGDPAMLGELEQLSSMYPDDPEVWYMLGEGRYHLGPQVLVPLAEAADAFRRAIALDSSYAPAYLHLMEVRLGEGRDRTGIEKLLRAYDRVAADDTRMRAFRLALTLAHPPRDGLELRLDTVPDEQIRYTFGILQRGGVGNAPAAATLLEQTIQEERSAVPPQLIAVMRSVIGIYTGRIQQALDAAPSADPTVLAEVAQEVVTVYGLELPDRVLEPALDLDSASTVPELLHAGVIAAYLGRDDVRRTAVARLRATAEGGDSLATHAAAMVQAYTLWREGDADGAAAEFERIRRETVGYGGEQEMLNEQVRYWSGALEAARGRHEQALPYLRSLPWSSFARLLLAEAYEALGRTDEARRAYGDVLRIWAGADADFTPVERARRGLARLGTDRAEIE